MRIAIIGNSGSGKSTLARWLAERGEAKLLDLDTLAWEPGQIAVARDPETAAADVRAFCSAHEKWVVEGCYAGLVRATLTVKSAPFLLFLDPGLDRCLANCRSRPWEPHKYASKADQDQRLPMLLDWVADYYERSGDLSWSAHRELYDAWTGRKEMVQERPRLEPPTDAVLAWLGA